ncbi:MAG: zinc-dependent dehydrogenase [Candidatus Omnitrophica bacterium]|nr:zinc-dependent dehydrogenase [Candidatus Omnitrophota bacterium]MDD5553980.1 zinc-dependent dehydrogenase [Candidatus Omnitrophota bacterium]
MRAAVYYSNSDIRIEEKPLPEIGPGELLIRVEASGICGSDVMEWYRIHRIPLILGHEIAGTVEAAGEGVKGYKKGDRVACAHHVPCGKCHYCLSGHETVCDTLRKTNFDPGGFCEFLRLPGINADKGVFRLPDTVSFEEATFIEPLACVLRGQRQACIAAKRAGIKGASVLVIGSGIAGLLHIHLAKVMGAGCIVSTDISEYRLEAAKKFGAGASLNAGEYSVEALRSVNQGRLADIVIVTAGSVSAIGQAFSSVERGGTVLFFAPTDKDRKIQLPFNELFWRTEITLTSSYAGSPADYGQGLDLIASGKLNIKDMITHRLSLSETGKGFKLVADAAESIKVIIFPQK